MWFEATTDGCKVPSTHHKILLTIKRKEFMRTLKVFVVSYMEITSNSNTHEILRVCATKTEAKECLARKRAEILRRYEENYPDNFEEDECNSPTWFSISTLDGINYDEVVVTEMEVG